MKYPNIFLIGFMGSGKSHWGRIWSEEMHLPFMDLDHEIEAAEGMSVEDIFKKKGEDGFREAEKHHLRKIKNNVGLLVACGGGAPCFSENMTWMLKNGVVIYLKASPQYLLDRVIEEIPKRPLLKEINKAELLFFIQKKLEERKPVYNRAQIILDAKTLTKERLSETLQEYFSQKNKKASVRP